MKLEMQKYHKDIDILGKHIFYFKQDVFCVPKTTFIEREKDVSLMLP